MNKVNEKHIFINFEVRYIKLYQARRRAFSRGLLMDISEKKRHSRNLHIRYRTP